MATGRDPRFFYDTIADKFEGLDHPHDLGKAARDRL